MASKSKTNRQDALRANLQAATRTILKLKDGEPFPSWFDADKFFESFSQSFLPTALQQYKDLGVTPPFYKKGMHSHLVTDSAFLSFFKSSSFQLKKDWVGSKIKEAIEKAKNGAVKIASTAGTAIKKASQKAVEALKKGLGSVKAFFSSLPGKIKTLADNAKISLNNKIAQWEANAVQKRVAKDKEYLASLPKDKGKIRDIRSLMRETLGLQKSEPFPEYLQPDSFIADIMRTAEKQTFATKDERDTYFRKQLSDPAFVESIQTYAATQNEKAGRMAIPFTERIKNGIAKGTNTVATTIKKVPAIVATGFKTMIGTVKEFFVSVKDKTIQIAGKVKDKTVEIAGKVKDTSVKVGSVIKDTAVNAGTKIKEAAQKTKNGTVKIVSTAGTAIKKASQKAVEGVKKDLGPVKNFFVSVKDAAKMRIAKIKEHFRQKRIEESKAYLATQPAKYTKAVTTAMNSVLREALGITHSGPLGKNYDYIDKEVFIANYLKGVNKDLTDSQKQALLATKTSPLAENPEFRKEALIYLEAQQDKQLPIGQRVKKSIQKTKDGAAKIASTAGTAIKKVAQKTAEGVKKVFGVIRNFFVSMNDMTEGLAIRVQTAIESRRGRGSVGLTATSVTRNKGDVDAEDIVPDENVEITPEDEIGEVTDERIGLTTDDIITPEDTGEERSDSAPSEERDVDPFADIPKDRNAVDEEINLTPGGEIEDAVEEVAVTDSASTERTENIPIEERESPSPSLTERTEDAPIEEETAPEKEDDKEKKPAEKSTAGGDAGVAAAPSSGGGGRGFGFLKFLGILGMVLGFGLMIAATLLSGALFGAIAAPIAGLMMATGSGAYFLSYGLSSDKQTLYKAADKVLAESEEKSKKENETSAEADTESEKEVSPEAAHTDEVSAEEIIEDTPSEENYEHTPLFSTNLNDDGSARVEEVDLDLGAETEYKTDGIDGYGNFDETAELSKPNPEDKTAKKALEGRDGCGN